MRIFTLTLCSLLLSVTVFAQPWLKNLPAGKSKSELTLFDYQQAFETYWAPYHVDKGAYYVKGVKKKAAGWKQFKRWEYEMLSKINVHTGEFPKRNTIEIVEEFEKTHPAPRQTREANWTPLGPVYSNSGYSGIGRINCVAFHPTDLNTYWVGAAAGGLWMTTDHGDNWTCLTNDNAVLAVSDIVIPADYETSRTIYIATGDRDGWDNRSVGVLKSTDGGQSWTTTGLTYTIFQGQMVNRLLMDPSNPNILIAATTQGVYKTIDAGNTWNTQMFDREFIDMEFKPGQPGVIYGSTKGGSIFLSTDGATFSQEVFHDDAARRTELAVSAAQPDIVYALCSNDGSALHAIYKSINSGNSFDEVFSGSVKNLLTWESDGSGEGGQGWYDLTIAASPNNADVVVIGGVNSWRSLNGGLDWSIINHWWGDQVPAVHADKHMLRFRENGDLFECNDGGIYYSTDNGTSWDDKTNGIQISQMYRLGVSQTNDDDVITGLQDNGTKLFSDHDWFDVLGGDGMECLIDYTDNNIQYGTLYFGSLDRTDNHWQNSHNITPPDEGAWVTPFIIDPNNPNILYGGYSDLWKTVDRGESWFEISDINLDGRLRCVAIAHADPQYIYISNYNQIWKTTDGGGQWNQITNNLPSNDGTIEYITVKYDDPNTIWVVLSGYSVPGVYESVDGGNSWNSISEGLPPIPAYSLVQNIQNALETHLYLGTDLGVYFKEAGHDWVPFNDGLPNVRTGEIEIYYDGDPGESKLRVATYGRGLWESPIEYTPSSMVFVSGTALHKNTNKIPPGVVQQEILKVEVLTNGNLNPLNVTSFTFNTNGSTNPSGDITGAQLYYTGASGTFATATPFGEYVTSPNGEFTFTSDQQLGNGKNNFWLAYDISADATPENVVDAQCLAVTVVDPHTLLVSDPPGNRTIGVVYCVAGAIQDTYEYIAGVQMGWINQESDKGLDGYQDFSHISMDVQRGQEVNVNVTNGEPFSSDQVIIWADWNIDGDFYDSGEYVAETPLFGGEVFETFFTVPEFARPGKTKMRIRLHDASNGPNITPCDDAEWGEVEDYSLIVHAKDTCGPLNYLKLNAENIPGTYEPLGDNGSVIVTDNFDDANSTPQEIGFPFVFKCDTFQQFILNTNGFIKLGNTSPSKADYYFDTQRNSEGGPFNSFHPADINLLCPLNINLTGGSGIPEYRVHVTGDAPNRVCIIQFKDLADAGPDPIPQYEKIEFQVKLYETSNVIEFVYGDWVPSGNENDFRTVCCGIKGSSSFDDQLIVGSKGTEQFWEEIYFNNTNYLSNVAVWYSQSPTSPKPDPGRTFRFSLPSPPVVGFVSGGNVFCQGEQAELELSFHEGSIQWQESPDGIDNWTNVTTGEGWDTPEYITPPLTSTTYYRVEVSQPTHPSIYSNTEAVIVHNQPGDAGLITGDIEVCQGDSAVVYSVELISNASLYVWNFPEGAAGMSTTNIVEVKFFDDAVSGEITVYGHSGLCSGASSSLNVTVLQQPTQPVIIQNGTTLSSDAINGNQWYNQDGPIVGATNQDYEVTEDGTYYVIVTDGQCGSAPSNGIQVIISSVEIDGNEYTLQLFPNPVQDQLIIEIKGNVVYIPFEIHNALGHKVLEGELTDRVLVETDELIPGIYFLRLKDDGIAETRRFVKE